MTNYRKQIRDAALAVIDTAALGFDEISIGRRNRIPEDLLPACCIYTDAEDTEASTIQSPRLLQRQLALLVNIKIAGTDDALDDLAYSIEEALATSNRLNLPFLKNLVITGWAVEAAEEDADQVYLDGTLAFKCIYESTEY